MPQATGRDLHIDSWLSQIALNYRPTGMIADQIAPIVSVAKETDVYPIFNRGEAYAIEDTRRSRGTEARRVTRSVGSGNYVAKNYALAYDLPVEDRANMDAALSFELENGAVRYLTDKLVLDWDRRILNVVGSASNVSTGFLPASSWIGGGDPISQLWAVMEQVQSQTGTKPNSMVFGWRAWNMFRRNAQARNFVNGTNNGGGALTRGNAQSALELDRLIVAGAFYNTANEAQAAVLSNNPLHDSVLAYYAPLAPSRDTPSFMYSFRWTDPQLGAPFAAIRHPYDSRKRVEGVEVQYYQDERVTGSEYGALLRGVGSSQGSGIT